jgi:hypothetical protein
MVFRTYGSEKYRPHIGPEEGTTNSNKDTGVSHRIGVPPVGWQCFWVFTRTTSVLGITHLPDVDVDVRGSGHDRLRTRASRHHRERTQGAPQMLNKTNLHHLNGGVGCICEFNLTADFKIMGYSIVKLQKAGHNHTRASDKTPKN